MTCANCHTENPAGHKFCFNCGYALALACAHCGTENDPGNRFCFNCGHAMGDVAQPAETETDTAPAPAPSERRLVSVLFADLVGFTTFSESRDPEDVRAMLTTYFDRARDTIERFGGQVDKFIGDAVMGVWGAVGSHEDDAERATRAALELVDMVTALGIEIGVPELELRAGVMSGSTSVGPGGNEKGLVVGDLVNTASRLQSIAAPGTVLVGEATRDLAAGAIAFEPLGEQHIKGKSMPVTAYEARRVVAGISPRRDTDLNEAPFVGREDELRLLKDQLHAVGRDRRARLVSIVGEAGIGKTRLSQELLRYVDGIVEAVYYHHGRSPAYGDGVTFWALGEMVRQRAGIAEGDDPAKSRMKLRTAVAEFAPDEEDQRWIEPRLAGLIGVAEMPPGDRAELFAALRAFFLKVAERGTTLMVFEDLHWADDGLIDFIDELVERTARHPILVVTLGRPDLLDRRPTWGSGQKRTMSMHLARLDHQAMLELIGGLAPGLPTDAIEHIVARAAGVPLYGIEFVRMLVNTGSLAREGTEYRFSGDPADLAVPDSLQAVIGARIDRLPRHDRDVVQDAAVLGMSFGLQGLATMRGDAAEDLVPVLRSLVRSEVLEYEEDPRSPERGQYRFVQSLIKEVAYGRLSRRERVGRHLRVAEQFEAQDDPEVAAIIAAHYARAAAADPNDQELAARALGAVVAAAERAAVLHSHAQALGLYERAIEMTSDPATVAELKLSAAGSADQAALSHRAAELAREAYDWFGSEGEETDLMRAATKLAEVLTNAFEVIKAAEAIEPVYHKVERRSDETWARLASETARALMLSGRDDDAILVADEALAAAEELELADVALHNLINKGTSLGNRGRFVEAGVVLSGAAEIAKEYELTAVRARALNNLAIIIQSDDIRTLISRYEELDEVIERVGDDSWLVRRDFFTSLELTSHGRYTEAMAALDRVDPDELSAFWRDHFEMSRLDILLSTEGFDAARHARLLELLDGYLVESTDPQLTTGLSDARVRALIMGADFATAAADAVRTDTTMALYPQSLELATVAAGWIGDQATLDTVKQHVQQFAKGRVNRGLGLFVDAVDAAVRGDRDRAADCYSEAAALWAETQAPGPLATMQAAFAKALGPSHPVAAVAAADAQRWFAQTGSTLFLELFAEVFVERPGNHDGGESVAI